MASSHSKRFKHSHHPSHCDLPYDVVERILRLVSSYADLSNCSNVCRRWREAAIIIRRQTRQRFIASLRAESPMKPKIKTHSIQMKINVRVSVTPLPSGLCSLRPGCIYIPVYPSYRVPNIPKVVVNWIDVLEYDLNTNKTKVVRTIRSLSHPRKLSTVEICSYKDTIEIIGLNSWKRSEIHQLNLTTRKWSLIPHEPFVSSTDHSKLGFTVGANTIVPLINDKNNELVVITRPNFTAKVLNYPVSSKMPDLESVCCKLQIDKSNLLIMDYVHNDRNERSLIPWLLTTKRHERISFTRLKVEGDDIASPPPIPSGGIATCMLGNLALFVFQSINKMEYYHMLKWNLATADISRLVDDHVLKWLRVCPLDMPDVWHVFSMHATYKELVLITKSSEKGNSVTTLDFL